MWIIGKYRWKGSDFVIFVGNNFFFFFLVINLNNICFCFGFKEELLLKYDNDFFNVVLIVLSYIKYEIKIV